MKQISTRQDQQKVIPEMLSVIVPAYNCPTIHKDLQIIHRHLLTIRQPFEIICVIDGLKSARDTTRIQAKKSKNKDTKIYFYSKNRGKGYAIRYGMARARGGIVAFIDAGSDLKALGISMALEHMKWYQADIIIGSKRHPASRVTYPLRRRILSFIVQRITRFFFGLNVTDTQTGLKVFRRPVLEKVLPRLLVKRWAFDLEILSVARRLGFTKIYESPIELQYNFASNIDAGAVRNFAIDYLAILYRTYILHYYDDSHNDMWRDDPKLTPRYK